MRVRLYGFFAIVVVVGLIALSNSNEEASQPAPEPRGAVIKIAPNWSQCGLGLLSAPDGHDYSVLLAKTTVSLEHSGGCRWCAGQVTDAEPTFDEVGKEIEIVEGWKPCAVKVVTGPDGHDYLVVHGSLGAAHIHAVGCRACARR